MSTNYMKNLHHINVFSAWLHTDTQLMERHAGSSSIRTIYGVPVTVHLQWVRPAWPVHLLAHNAYAWNATIPPCVHLRFFFQLDQLLSILSHIFKVLIKPMILRSRTRGLLCFALRQTIGTAAQRLWVFVSLCVTRVARNTIVVDPKEDLRAHTPAVNQRGLYY